MSTLLIDRLTADVHAGPDRSDARSRAERRLAEVAEWGLSDAMDHVPLPAGLWFVRRLDLRLPVTAGAPERDAARSWSTAILAALLHALAVPGGVVHYRHRLALLADAVVGIATGRLDREWAWRQAGLLDRGGPRPALPGPAIIAVFDRSPELTVPALVQAVQLCGLPALDLALGREGWQEIVRLAALPRMSPCEESASPVEENLTTVPPPGRLGADRERGRTPEGPASLAGAAVVAGGPAATRASRPLQGLAPPAYGSARLRSRAEGVVSASRFAQAARRSRLRPPAQTLAVWASLAVAEVDPGLLGAADFPGMHAATLALLGQVVAPAPSRVRFPSGGTTTRRPPPTPLPSPQTEPTVAPAPASAPSTGPAPSAPPSGNRREEGRSSGDGSPAPIPTATAAGTPRGTATRTAPAGPSMSATVADPTITREAERPREAGAPAEGAPTEFAGLVFLLGAAAAAGIPFRPQEDPALAGRPIRWVLSLLGRAIVPVAPDDPALLALCGLEPGRAHVSLDGPEPTPAERRRLLCRAHRWRRAAADRLRLAGAPPGQTDGELVARLAGRPGHIVADPGWIEVVLPIGCVDTTIRRAGLDLDPGWVPWLGVVVEYRYE